MVVAGWFLGEAVCRACIYQVFWELQRSGMKKM